MSSPFVATNGVGSSNFPAISLTGACLCIMYHTSNKANCWFSGIYDSLSYGRKISPDADWPHHQTFACFRVEIQGTLIHNSVTRLETQHSPASEGINVATNLGRTVAHCSTFPPNPTDSLSLGKKKNLCSRSSSLSWLHSGNNSNRKSERKQQTQSLIWSEKRVHQEPM